MELREKNHRVEDALSAARPLEVEDEMLEGDPAADPLEDTVVSAPRLDTEKLQEMAQRLTKNK